MGGGLGAFFVEGVGEGPGAFFASLRVGDSLGVGGLDSFGVGGGLGAFVDCLDSLRMGGGLVAFVGSLDSFGVGGGEGPGAFFVSLEVGGGLEEAGDSPTVEDAGEEDWDGAFPVFALPFEAPRDLGVFVAGWTAADCKEAALTALSNSRAVGIFFFSLLFL